LRTLVSQGCRPIGDTYVVTRADRNLLQELAGEPPVERIREIFTHVDPSDRELMRAGLHIGLVIDEYRDDFRRGDFLVRGVLGAQSGTGAIAIGDHVRVGQTVRFQVRDAASADSDLRELLDDARAGTRRPAAALLFTCNGRGSRLFGTPNHDAEAVRAALGGIPLAGFFCAGEFGPVGQRSYLHGFTASLLVVDHP
jgi:small ligand-binding sensory domain FIST